nr:hypothetical protein [uncultured Sphingosinicella sp.]
MRIEPGMGRSSARALARAARAEAVEGDRSLPCLDDRSRDPVSLRGLVYAQLASRDRRGGGGRSTGQ